MKILITGAAGFIGSQLAHRLWLDGAEVILVDNFSYGSKDNLIFDDYDFNSCIIHMDIRDKDAIAKLLSCGDIDFIYHIAGIAPLPECQIDPQEAIDVNVIGLVNVIENARKYGVKKIIFASTNAIYENETKFPTCEEKFALPTLIYPNTKYMAERFCESYCTTYGMNITCLRFSNVYGPHIDCLRKQPPFVGYMIREIYYDRIPVFHSDGKQSRDYIYIDDLIDLAVKVQNSVGFDCVNVSANKSYSVNELYAITLKIMEKDIKAEYVSPQEYWKKYQGLYEGKYKIKNEILEHEVNKYSLCDNAYAKRKYGWEPKTDIVEGLKRAINYEIKLLMKMDNEVK